jgi:hypothetical protein
MSTSGAVVAPPDRDRLVAALRRLGVGFYAPSDAEEGPRALTASELISGLAASPEARLRDALVALLMRHPEFAPDIAVTSGKLRGPAAEALREQYTAAACLQRLWRTTLALYLPDTAPLPDLFGPQLDLPPLDDFHGELALRELAARSDFNQLAAWHAVADQLLAQLALEAPGELAPAR